MNTRAANGQSGIESVTAQIHDSHADGLAHLNGTRLDLIPGAVDFYNPEGVVRWNQRAVDLWGREPKAGDRSQCLCGSYNRFRLDITIIAHADGPMAVTLRTGRPQRSIEANIAHRHHRRRRIGSRVSPCPDSPSGYQS